MSFIKLKALYMIVLITFFTLAIYTPQAEAQQQECCERTRDGAFCLYTDASNCEGPNHAPAFCEDTSFCTLGCCFDSNSGECFSNTAKSECDQLGGTWDSSQSCAEVAQCSIGCCQLNNQAFLSTLTKCKQVSSQFSDTEPNFDAGIQDEFSCLNSVRSQELGCCVTENSCGFTTRSQCSQQERNPIEEAQLEEEPPADDITGAQIQDTTNNAVGFHPGVLCSLDSLGCTAAKQHHLGCYQGDVYWFDSEDNPENVFLGDSGTQKRSSYNNGRILQDPGCTARPNDPECGNCDYPSGTICSEEGRDPRCIDLNCQDTTNFANSPDSGSSKNLGESWCVFDGPVGFGQDLPGSRHFRAACINGEEIIEPCRDFREEFCTQSMSNGRQTNQYGSFYNAITQNFPALQGESPISDIFLGPDYSEAGCRENRQNSCSQCNEFSTTEEISQCCNELAYRDCYFLQAGISNKGGTCVPNVPKGAQFWSDASSVLERQSIRTVQGEDEVFIANVPSVPADNVCAEANTECEVGFSRTEFSDWKCTYNCQCLTEDYFIAAHSICRAKGDCGASFNIADEVTRKGFDIKFFGPKGGEVDSPKLRQDLFSKINSGLLDDALVREPKETGGPKKYDIGDFFSDTAVPLSLIGISGLLGIGTQAGFFGGLFFGPGVALGSLGAAVTGISSASGLITPGQTLGEVIFGAVPKGTIQAQSPVAGVQQSVRGVFPRATVVNSGSIVPEGLALSKTPVTLASNAPISAGQTLANTGSNVIPLNFPAGTEFAITNAQGVATSGIVEAGGTITWLEPSKVTEILGPGPDLLATGISPGNSIVVTSGQITTGAAAEGALTGISTGAEGITSATTTSLTTAVNPLAVVWGVVQVISWIWTIYNIIDLLGAETATGKVEFLCKAWEPPSGGSNCELCNPTDDNPLPCSEYRCRALGKSCKLINQGSKNELCVNTLPQDTQFPRIAADKERMDFNVQDDPNRGFTITDPIPPFTAVSLAIKTDEPAQCKFSTEPGIEFENQEFDFGSPLLDFRHQIDFSLPSELAEDQALQLTNGGRFTLYVRCEDANGNKNRGDYTINFQIAQGPDVTPPRIQSTSILSGTFIRSGVETVALDIFVNEPSTCKWSNRDIQFNLMENSFSCTASVLDIEAVNTGSYRCSDSLTIEATTTNTIKNTFYFSCKDRSDNTNQKGFRYQLLSTPELTITETSPEEILRSGVGITLEVKTANGAESGKANCGVSQENLPFTDLPLFQNTDSTTHTQTIQLLDQGPYTFFVTCIDKAGNQAQTTIDFSVEADSSAPVLFSVFKDTQLGILTITTNEPTICRYSDQNFEFTTGIPMTNDNSITHEANLGNFMYTIKCQDEFTNEATFTVFP